MRALLPAEAALPSVLQAVHARTAGNPFYVAELVRLLATEGRLGDDTGDARARARARGRAPARRAARRRRPARVLEVGAVAGRFTIADLVRAAGVSARRGRGGAATAAPAAGLVVAASEPGHFAFAHGIVRDAVRDALPERGAARCTRRSPRALTRPPRRGRGRRGGRRSPTTRWPPRARGADPQPAWEAALEAAREAEAALGHAEAAAHYAEALEALALGAEAPAAERRATLLALAEATFAAGDIEDARRPLLAGRGRRPPRRRRARRSPTPRSGSRSVQPVRRGRQRERRAAQPGARARCRTPTARCARASPACCAVLRARPGAARGADRRGAGDGRRLATRRRSPGSIRRR